MLVNSGAAIHAVDRWGRTPLDDAVAAGHAEVVQFLEPHAKQVGTWGMTGGGVGVDTGHDERVIGGGRGDDGGRAGEVRCLGVECSASRQMHRKGGLSVWQSRHSFP